MIEKKGLNLLTELPKRFFDVKVEEVGELFSGPTLIHLKSDLKSKKSEKLPLFVSTLLHGNETTGFYALQRWLIDLKPDNLHRDIMIFIGNVNAATANLRRNESEPDFNRIWNQACLNKYLFARELHTYLKNNRPVASIDVHNTSGDNPTYSCVNRLDMSALDLAAEFSKIIVYFTQPDGVMTKMLSEISPAVTLESGRSQDWVHIDEVARYLSRCYEDVESLLVSKKVHESKVFHSLYRLEVHDSSDFMISSDARDDCSLVIRKDLESLNFQELDSGTIFGWLNGKSKLRNHLSVYNESREDVTDNVFEVKDGSIQLVRTLIPSMLTVSEPAIKLDCLGYLMERVELS